MYKKILAPLDGSEFSECILEHAKSIALGCSTPDVVLLMVVEPAQLEEDLREKVDTKNKKAAKDYLAKVADRLKKEGLAAQSTVIVGKPADAILDYAAKNKVDLIVMSTHGRSGITRWAAGSVADRVMRNSPAPVLLVAPSGCRVR